MRNQSLRTGNSIYTLWGKYDMRCGSRESDREGRRGAVSDREGKRGAVSDREGRREKER